ncbi:hypothetical protein D9611_006635 [Ephemerocybe angulata]|uniref:Uncharacterized protein n=1 Tax=Ephemerocybe angulata TaxID=980116 RepID=A0A8H5C7A6_9AGAR|nr:hypothetical protein D9611_006635 [Tulosesus angulatus]
MNAQLSLNYTAGATRRDVVLCLPSAGLPPPLHLFYCCKQLMPEYREVTAHYVHVQLCLEKLQETNSTTVLDIWADPSLKAHEADLSPTKCVIRLTRSMNVTRGSKSSKVSLFPQILPHDKPISSLAFRDVSMTPRAVRLDFTVMHLQLAFLTHTSVQFFSQNLWDEVKATSQEKRKFRVGMAFEFKTHVLAFVSLDNLFQPFWALRAIDLPEGHIDAYKDLRGFLFSLVRWMENRRKRNRLGLATEIIRKGEKGKNVFGGVGKYTVLELFFMGGLSPFLTEQDVFDDPSRTARFILALWCYQHHSVTKIAGLLRPCMVDLVVAPSKLQRESFYQRWIHIYTCDKIKVPLRMFEQLTDIEAALKDSAKELFDPFEPTFIKEVWDVLKDGGDLPLSTTVTLEALANLAFGKDKWVTLGGRATDGSDQLTSYFRKRGLLVETPTTINVSKLESLVAPDPHRQWKVRTIYAHKSPVGSVSTFWSIVPMFPNRFSKPKFGKSRRQVLFGWIVSHFLINLLFRYENFYRASKHDRERELYKYIIWKTRKVGIGPLEYRGHAVSALTKHRKRIVSAVETEREVILAAYNAQSKKQRSETLTLMRSSPLSTPLRKSMPGLTFSSSPARSSSPILLTPSRGPPPAKKRKYTTCDMTLGENDHPLTPARKRSTRNPKPFVPVKRAYRRRAVI